MSLGACSLLPTDVLPDSSPPRTLWDGACCRICQQGTRRDARRLLTGSSQVLQAPLGTKFTRQHTNTDLGTCCWPCCWPLPSWKGPCHAGTFAQHPPDDQGKAEEQGKAGSTAGLRDAEPKGRVPRGCYAAETRAPVAARAQSLWGHRLQRPAPCRSQGKQPRQQSQLSAAQHPWVG